LRISAPSTPARSNGRSNSSSPRSAATPAALANVLGTFVDTPREALARVAVPTLVVAGVDDDQRGSVQALAALLPDGRYAPVPGDHVSALMSPELAVAIVDFLGPPN
jgi:pimeloyl-ACP methyl ester carboxylesterase